MPFFCDLPHKAETLNQLKLDPPLGPPPLNRCLGSALDLYLFCRAGLVNY